MRRGHAAPLVEDAAQGNLAGYALVLFNQGTSQRDYTPLRPTRAGNDAAWLNAP